MAGSSGGRSIDVGLLVLRIGIGLIFICHGLPDLLGGPDAWRDIGGKGMGVFHVTSGLAIWGFAAKLVETLGGLLLILGFLVRPAAFLMCGVMIVATLWLLPGGFKEWSHPASLAVVFLTLVITGAGSLDVVELLRALKTK